jgi:hypothetical protein
VCAWSDWTGLGLFIVSSSFCIATKYQKTRRVILDSLVALRHKCDATKECSVAQRPNKGTIRRDGDESTAQQR